MKHTVWRQIVVRLRDKEGGREDKPGGMFHDRNRLKTSLSDPNWQEGVWADAVTKAIDETGLDSFPADCP